MSALSDDLVEVFPDKADLIHKLKTTDHHFANLLQRNHALWKEIQQISTDIAPASDETLEGLRKKRLAVLDEIGMMLAKAAG